MSSIEKYSDRIADYIYNDMGPKDRELFEIELLANQELREEYERQAGIIDYLISRSSLEEMISDPNLAEARRIADSYMDSSEMLTEEIEKGRPRFNVRRKVLYPVIGIAAALCAILLFRVSSSSNQNERIFSRYYNPLEASSFVYRGKQKQLDLLFKAGMSLYIEGAYLESTNSFEEIVSIDPDNIEANLYYGLSLVGEKRYKEAVEILEDYKERFNKYSIEATWYLGLCHLKLENSDQATSYFEELSEVGGYYGEKSQSILKRMGN